MARWTERQVIELAPDRGAVSAARTLVRPGPWSDTGSTDALVWGKCQGSGRTPYQVSVDLTGPAFRCSCPSRKFPCKHALALLLLWVAGAGSVADVGAASAYAPEWADQRASAASTRATPVAKAGPDAAAQAKRVEQRLTLMSAGMDDFATWLSDLARTGLAAARQQPYRWWDDTAARLVDAQLPGLAEQVRAMASQVARREDWADHLLAGVGRWWVATRAWADRDALSGAELADLRVLLGWNQATADVRATDRVGEDWVVLGVHRSEEGRIQQQRTWLRGERTGEIVQVLDFAAGETVLAVPQLAGAVLTAELARYPGSAPRRALFVEAPAEAGSRATLPTGGTIDAAYARAAHQWAASPWTERVPALLDHVRVVAGVGGQPAQVQDREGDRLPLHADSAVWLLLALVGGEEVQLFGELDDDRFRPLSVSAQGTVTPL